MSEGIEYLPDAETREECCMVAAAACQKVIDLVPPDRLGAAQAVAALLAGVAAGNRPRDQAAMHRQVDLLRGDDSCGRHALLAVATVRTAAMCVTHPEHAEHWAREASAAADRLVAEVTARA